MNKETIDYLKTRNFNPPDKWQSDEYVLVVDSDPKVLYDTANELINQNKKPIILIEEMPITQQNRTDNFRIRRMYLGKLLILVGYSNVLMKKAGKVVVAI